MTTLAGAKPRDARGGLLTEGTVVRHVREPGWGLGVVGGFETDDWQLYAVVGFERAPYTVQKRRIEPTMLRIVSGKLPAPTEQLLAVRHRYPVAEFRRYRKPGHKRWGFEARGSRDGRHRAWGYGDDPAEALRAAYLRMLFDYELS